MADTPIPPVFVWDPEKRELLAFETLASALAHLRPWQEVGILPAYDAEGRRLSFAVAPKPGRLAKLFPSAAEKVVLSGLESGTEGASELHAALVTKLAEGEAGRHAALEARPLAELVELATSRGA